MATTREEIRQWLEDGKTKGSTHLIVVCDTFDHEDYPVYVSPSEDVSKKIAGYSNPKEMQKVMEVYSYKLPLESQLSEHRAYHLD